MTTKRQWARARVRLNERSHPNMLHCSILCDLCPCYYVCAPLCRFMLWTPISVGASKKRKWKEYQHLVWQSWHRYRWSFPFLLFPWIIGDDLVWYCHQKYDRYTNWRVENPNDGIRNFEEKNWKGWCQTIFKRCEFEITMNIVTTFFQFHFFLIFNSRCKRYQQNTTMNTFINLLVMFFSYPQ